MPAQQLISEEEMPMLVNFPQCLLCFVFHNSMPLYVSWEFLFDLLGSAFIMPVLGSPQHGKGWGWDKPRLDQQTRGSQLVTLGKMCILWSHQNLPLRAQVDPRSLKHQKTCQAIFIERWA